LQSIETQKGRTEEKPNGMNQFQFTHPIQVPAPFAGRRRRRIGQAERTGGRRRRRRAIPALVAEQGEASGSQRPALPPVPSRPDHRRRRPAAGRVHAPLGRRHGAATRHSHGRPVSAATPLIKGQLSRLSASPTERVKERRERDGPRG